MKKNLKIPKTRKKTEEVEEEEEEGLKIYSAEEMTKLSVFNLKKLKLDSNSKIANRKVSLKSKSGIWTPDKIASVKKEILDLENQVVLLDKEIAARKESAE